MITNLGSFWDFCAFVPTDVVMAASKISDEMFRSVWYKHLKDLMVFTTDTKDMYSYIQIV